jgi:hypothetical protein
MTDYVFKTPTVREGPIGRHRLFYFYKLDKAVSVVYNGTSYSLTRFETDEDLNAYQVAYRGGRNHTVDEATKTALIAAGIGIDETNFTAI